jgi:hypothetical protein
MGFSARREGERSLRIRRRKNTDQPLPAAAGHVDKPEETIEQANSEQGREYWDNTDPAGPFRAGAREIDGNGISDQYLAKYDARDAVDHFDVGAHQTLDPFRKYALCKFASSFDVIP